MSFPVGPWGRLVESLCFRTADWPLVPKGFIRLALPNPDPLDYGTLPQLSVALGTLGMPAGVELVEINVEAGRLRYTDDGSEPTTTRGELYHQGATFSRSIRYPAEVRLAAVDVGTIANVSLYGSYA